MNICRRIVLIIGLVFFLGIAVLDGIMAKASDSIKPLIFIWLLVPSPLVFFLLMTRPPSKRGIRLTGFIYLGMSLLLTLILLFGVAWVGSERAIHPQQGDKRLPQLSEFPRLKARVKEVWFKSRDNTNLSGWFIPGESKRTILLLHGYDQSRHQMLPHADILHRAGYSLFLFDFRSRGRSEGDAVTMGYYERGDVLGAIDYLKMRPDVDPTAFGVLGLSQGGATAILSASGNQEIKAIAVECVFKDLKSAIDQSFEHFIHLPAFPFAPLTVWIAERRTGIKTEEIAPEDAVAAISPRPILIMHGLQDTTIDPEDSKIIYAAAREPKQLWLIPTATHAEGVNDAPQEYGRRISAFFDAHLKRR